MQSFESTNAKLCDATRNSIALGHHNYDCFLLHSFLIVYYFTSQAMKRLSKTLYNVVLLLPNLFTGILRVVLKITTVDNVLRVESNVLPSFVPFSVQRASSLGHNACIAPFLTYTLTSKIESKSVKANFQNHP